MAAHSTEQQRTGLIQFLVVIVTLLQSVILFLSYRLDQGYLIPALAVMALVTCLYVLARERQLVKNQLALLDEVLATRRDASDLGRKLAAGEDATKDLGERLRELTMLYRAISTVNAVMDYEHTSSTVLRSALELVNGDCGSIMLLTGESEFELVAAVGHTDAQLGSRQPSADGVAGWVIQHVEPVLLSGDLENDPRFRNLVRRQVALQQSMCVPLRIRGDVLGVLNLGTSTGSSKQAFSEDDLRKASIFAQHASLAVENYKLLCEHRVYELQV